MTSVSSEITEHNFLMHILTFYEWIHARVIFSLCIYDSLRLSLCLASETDFNIKVFFFPFSITVKQFSDEPISFL